MDQDVSSVIKENPVPVPPSTAETAPRPGTMGQTGESAPEENRQNSLASTVSERVRKATLDMREQLQEVRQIACRGRLQGLWQPWCIAGLLCVLSVAAGATLQLRQSQAGQTASQQAHDSFMHQQEQTGQLWHDRLAGLEARLVDIESHLRDLAAAEAATVADVASASQQHATRVPQVEEVNLALYASGGRVVQHSAVIATHHTSVAWNLRRWVAHHSMGMLAPVIYPSADQYLLSGAAPVPGKCLPLQGSSGTITIQLPQPARLSGISVSHLQPGQVTGVQSAPRRIAVIASTVRDTQGAAVLSGTATTHNLGTVEYNTTEGGKQRFTLPGNMAISQLTLQILSNYGHPDYTCMYGVAIHGEIAKLIAGHQS